MTRNRRGWILTGLVLTIALLMIVPLAQDIWTLVGMIVAWQLTLNMMLGPLAAWAGIAYPMSRRGCWADCSPFRPRSAAGRVGLSPGRDWYRPNSGSWSSSCSLRPRSCRCCCSAGRGPFRNSLLYRRRGRRERRGCGRVVPRCECGLRACLCRSPRRRCSPISISGSARSIPACTTMKKPGCSAWR